MIILRSRHHKYFWLFKLPNAIFSTVYNVSTLASRGTIIVWNISHLSNWYSSLERYTSYRLRKMFRPHAITRSPPPYRRWHLYIFSIVLYGAVTSNMLILGMWRQATTTSGAPPRYDPGNGTHQIAKDKGISGTIQAVFYMYTGFYLWTWQ